MNVSALKNFVCPVEGGVLVKENHSLRCEQGHVFDLAREGYCHLLLVQQKASRNPGDSKEMVAARRRFLDGGYFAPVAEHVFEMVHGIVKKNGSQKPWRLVDAGCGEGYYLSRLKELASTSDHPARLELAGCDISKWAVKAAAKRSSAIAWAVAGNRRLPFAPDGVDLILSMFGFPIWESFKAVQPVDGRVLLVDPGVEHLLELRKIIYPEVNPGETPSLKAAMEYGYTLEREEPLKFSVNLESSSSIQDLLLMTPHAFRITEKRREDMRALKRLTVSVDLAFRVLRLDC